LGLQYRLQGSIFFGGGGMVGKSTKSTKIGYTIGQTQCKTKGNSKMPLPPSRSSTVGLVDAQLITTLQKI